MLHRLSAIEIAEGALLADVAALFLLLTLYLPVVGGLFLVPVPALFAVLVLRRGLYVGVMGACVALFVVGVMTGSHLVVLALEAATGGLFLGWAMRHRLRHVPILLLGVSGLAVFNFVFFLFFFWLSGLPMADIHRQIHQLLVSAEGTAAFVAQHVGRGGWWEGSARPSLPPLFALLERRWAAFLLGYLWVSSWPVVIVAYYVTNSLVRALGYRVRAFPGERLERLIARAVRLFARHGRRLGLPVPGRART